MGSSERSVGIKGGTAVSTGAKMVGRMGGRVGNCSTGGTAVGRLTTVSIGSGGAGVFGTGVDGTLVGVEPAAVVGDETMRGVAVLMGVTELRAVTVASGPVGVAVGVAASTVLVGSGPDEEAAVAVGFNGKSVVCPGVLTAPEASRKSSYRMDSLIGGMTKGCVSRL